MRFYSYTISSIGILILALITSCNSSDNVNAPATGTGSGNNSPGPGSGDPSWLIPNNQVFDGGPGKDGIPALVNPPMFDASQAIYLSDNDLVIGYKVGNDARAYPHKILDWHEIINDDINGKPVAIIYCPLTGTAIAWSRFIEGSVSTFGVSGLLYNTNLMPYDRAQTATGHR